VQIKPTTTSRAKLREASYKSTIGGRRQAEAELEKAEADFKRNEELFKAKLIPANTFADFRTALEVSRLRLESASHQADQARFALDRAADDLAKTTILARSKAPSRA
jgi:HlyD family secretion protein